MAQKLLIDLQSLDLYVICGQLIFVDGDWRWYKDTDANQIVIDISPIRPDIFEKRSYVRALRAEQKRIHELLLD
jgi:hypothetical protein